VETGKLHGGSLVARITAADVHIDHALQAAETVLPLTPVAPEVEQLYQVHGELGVDPRNPGQANRCLTRPRATSRVSKDWPMICAALDTRPFLRRWASC
jgi:hypothetical protein